MAGKALFEEITSQRRLLQAERGELAVEVSNVRSLWLLEEIGRLFCADARWADREIAVREDSEDVEVATDRVLLQRVLANMVKNALEATPPGGKVSLACAPDGSSAVFSVHNAGCMPRPVQLQMFQRSFSTKGKGRGIGTYSMKLFAEQYLKGKVWFSTSEQEGTTFFVSLPLLPEGAEPPPARAAGGC
jgi:signal transduction histidine kinase